MAFSDAETEALVRGTFVARVEQFASLTSTNDLARQRAADEHVELPLLILADEQTAGRGRGGNRWWTGPGGLAMSLLMNGQALGIGRDRSPLAALAVGVAVAETAAPLVPNHRVGVHWPNDVFVGDRKLAGVLVEVLSPRRWVLGVGVNTNNSLADAPPEVAARATTLRDVRGRVCDHAAVVRSFLNRFEELADYLAGRPEEVARRANALCLQRGQPLTVESAGVRTEGPCLGIAPDGALILETPHGRRTLHSGVVCRVPPRAPEPR